MAKDVLWPGPDPQNPIWPNWPRDANGVPLPFDVVGFGVFKVKRPTPSPFGETHYITDNRPRHPITGEVAVIPTITPGS